MAVSGRFSSSALSASVAAMPPGNIPLAARDRITVQRLFGPLTPVAGYPCAFLANTPAGKQLFIDTTQLPRSRWSTFDFAALWRAAFRKPLPNGYRARPYDDIGAPAPQDTPVGLVVIAIIAILIGLLLPAIQKVREQRQPGQSVIGAAPGSLQGILLN